MFYYYRDIKLRFSAKTVEIMDWLKVMTRVNTYAEIIQTALFLFYRIVKIILDGGQVKIIQKDGREFRLTLNNIGDWGD